MVAWIIAGIGTLIAGGVGLFHRNLTGFELAQCVAASNLAGFVGLWIVVRGQQSTATPGFLRSKILTGPARVWALLALVWFAVLLTLAPPLRDPEALAALAPPLILAAQFQTPLFGRLHDRWVARRQRRG